MTAPRVVPSRIPQLELLRVIATGGIFLYHLWMEIPLRTEGWLGGPLLARLPLLGVLGVMVFNLITGFVLSVPYLGHPVPRPLPPALVFFRQRFGRICRYYYPTLVLWTLVLLVVPAPGQPRAALLVPFATHLVFLHTLHPSTFFAIVPAFWWLGLLAQFYLVCPWLLRLYTRVGPGRACLLACLLPWGAWTGLAHLAHHHPGSPVALVYYMSYFNLLARLPEFALGMWLASAWNRALPLLHGHARAPAARSLRSAVVGPLLVGLVLVLVLQDPWLQQLGPIFGHLYLLGCCLGGVLAVFRWSWAVRLGRAPVILDLAGASYGIYLLHQPLLGYAHHGLAGLCSPASSFVVLLLGVGFLCYKAAVWFTRAVDRLFR